ncbi:MAG TPA: TfoX/Sxy family protein, partial [Polyangiaceae bacterium]|nr:TfoX/Sxy family protein [Polyangiaceae bacterium]
MKWTKPSAETIAYFERIAPGPPIEARRMFGMPARFLNGHMLVGVFGDTFMLHLSAADRDECIRAGAKPFAPMGREAKAYVDVKPGLFEDRALKEWIVRGMRYLGSLPPKLKAKTGPSSSKRGGAVERAASSSKRDGAAERGVASSKRSAPKSAAPAAPKATKAPAARTEAKVAKAPAARAAKKPATRPAAPARGAAKPPKPARAAAKPKRKPPAGARLLRDSGERAKKPSPK